MQDPVSTAALIGAVKEQVTKTRRLVDKARRQVEKIELLLPSRPAE